MITKSDIMKAAYEHGFEDVGFTTADPFPDHKQLLLDRREEYAWAETVGLHLLDGTDPTTILPNAKTIMIPLEASGLIGSIAGVADIAKAVTSNKE